MDALPIKDRHGIRIGVYLQVCPSKYSKYVTCEKAPDYSIKLKLRSHKCLTFVHLKVDFRCKRKKPICGSGGCIPEESV